MEKKIWIMNHYATNMFFNQGGRHYWFAENLLKQGYEPIIFCANTKHNNKVIIDTERRKYVIKETNGIPFVFVKTSPYQGNGFGRVKNMFGFSKNLLLIAKKFAKDYGKPDVILASSVHPLTLVVGIIIAKKFKIPCICESRDLWPETLVAYGAIKKESVFARILYKGEKWIYKKADKLIFTMQGGKDYIIEKGWDKASGGPIDLDKVHHINNGVDLEAFDYNKEHFQIDDADLKDNESFKVIYVGSIRLVNNLGLLLDTAKILKERGESKIKFLIWGDGNELEALKQRVQQEGLTNVSFKGRVDKKYVPYITSCGQLNIVLGKSSPLYKYGGSLNKMFDYFASGKPTLFTFRLGYSLIEKYEVGMELDTNDPIKIADAIMHFSEMPESQHQKYSINARAAAADFDFKILSSKLIKLLES
ncbi:MAG: glycosyltransferase family 4 protein [Clostridia bacterium]|nr:glycosyltransferase family 4 protein [Clostridia bacterium]